KFHPDVTPHHPNPYIQNPYFQHIQQIQKSKNILTQKPYILISNKFSHTSKQNVFHQLKNQPHVITQLLHNIFTPYYKLSAQTLNNHQLFRLIYTSIHYQNPQLNTTFQPSPFPISIPQQTKTRHTQPSQPHIQYKITYTPPSKVRYTLSQCTNKLPLP
ncbi:hypothetical protein, partial [Bacillus thuringiensis]|uniref:hypothetical protein n=1 Tax=Bacillus thuringiensis TaxID=1428 RepID=UPI001C92F2F8